MWRRPANKRGLTQTNWLQSWHSFSFADYFDPKFMQFSVLRVINQDIIAPGSGFGLHSHHDMEILTYVLRGVLQHEDSLGNKGIIRPHEMQRMSAGSGIRHSEANPSTSEEVELLQIWIVPSVKNLHPSYEQKSFPVIPNTWQLLVGAGNSALQIHQEMKLYRTFLDAGKSLTYEFNSRFGYLQLISGEVNANGNDLQAGDALALQGEDLKMQAQKDAHVLVFELPKT